MHCDAPDKEIYCRGINEYARFTSMFIAHSSILQSDMIHNFLFKCSDLVTFVVLFLWVQC